MKHKSDNRSKNATISLDIPEGLIPKPLLSEEMEIYRQKLTDDLAEIEKRIYELETFYWNQTTDIGNMLRGWDGYVNVSTSSGNTGARKSNISGGRSSYRSTQTMFTDKDRWFSLSSVTSPVELDIINTPTNQSSMGGPLEGSSVVGSVVSQLSDAVMNESETGQSNASSRKQKRS
ncbi:hypothetical protein ACR3K2_04220 [Cryptosporidium serpentis]